MYMEMQERRARRWVECLCWRAYGWGGVAAYVITAATNVVTQKEVFPK